MLDSIATDQADKVTFKLVEKGNQRLNILENISMWCDFEIVLIRTCKIKCLATLNIQAKKKLACGAINHF